MSKDGGRERPGVRAYEEFVHDVQIALDIINDTGVPLENLQVQQKLHLKDVDLRGSLDNFSLIRAHFIRARMDGNELVPANVHCYDTADTLTQRGSVISLSKSMDLHSLMVASREPKGISDFVGPHIKIDYVKVNLHGLTSGA